MLFDRSSLHQAVGLYFDKDGGAGGKPEDSAADKTDEKKSDESKAGDDAKKGKAEEDRKFSQAELDAIIDDRLKRERKKSEEAAEKARKKAEDEALTKNQEWQQLAEKRQKDLETLTQEKAGLEPFKEKAERYEKALMDQLTKVKEKLPKYLLPLIDKMDPVEAMAYIAEHAEELGAKPLTYSETPEGKEKKVTDEERKQAQKASGTLISRTF